MNRGSRRRTGLTVAVVVGYVAVAVALSWPLVLQLDTHHLGDDEHPGLRGDLFFQYTLQRQMERGQWPTLRTTDLLSHPVGAELDARVAFSQYMVAYVALMTVCDLLPARNLAGLAFLVLNALAMHLLARYVIRREAFAWLSGLLFGFGPYVFLKVEQGFVQKSCLFFVPLFLLFVLRVARGGRWWDHALMLASMVGLLLLYPPYGVFSLALGALFVLVEGLDRGELRITVRRIAPGAALVLLAFLAVFLLIRGDPRPVNMELTPRSYQALGGYLDPLHPFRWFPYEHTFSHPPTETIPYLPLGLPILVTVVALFAAAMGAPRTRWFVAAAGVMLVVMLGPYLVLGDEADPRRIPLPFLVLGQLPMGSVLKFPIRLYPWVLIVLLLAAGGGVRVLEGWVKGLSPRLVFLVAPALLVGAVVENRLVFPEYARFTVDELEVPRFYRDVAGEDFEALLILPGEPLFSNDYLHDAVTSGRPLVNAYMGQSPAIPIPDEPLRGEPLVQFHQALLDEGVGYIVVRKHGILDPNYLLSKVGYEPGQRAFEGPDPYRWLDTLCGGPLIYAADDMVVYRVPGSP